MPETNHRMKSPFVFSHPTDKMPGAWHGAYLGVYARLFAPIRKTKDSILEIGVDGAGSLLMYAEYFKNAKPVGMDIQTKPHALIGNERTIYYQGDSYSEDGIALMQKHSPFALCVDDGPHTLSSQKIFCAKYPPMLSPDGLCIVEDCQSIDHIAQLAAAVPDGFFSFVIDLRHHGRYDNILFCITRR
jgi:cephalosporin hydroxylase